MHVIIINSSKVHGIEWCVCVGCSDQLVSLGSVFRPAGVEIRVKVSVINHELFLKSRVSSCSLKPLDVQFMKAIHNKVNVVPVIAKADTLTLKERERLKRRVTRALLFLRVALYTFNNRSDVTGEGETTVIRFSSTGNETFCR